MKKIKYILSIAILSTIILSIVGCGGGSSSFANSEEKVDISIACVTTPTSTDISNYITLQSGDTIVQNENNTSIKTYHDTNNNKKVCLVSGSAYILRK